MIDLNILIPTVESRNLKLNRLLDTLNKQRVSNVLISVNSNHNDLTIGEKRNIMLSEASGRYIAFIDDDDTVSDDYIADILSIIKNDQPDVIGFKVAYSRNGIPSGTIDQSTKYKAFQKNIFRKPDGSMFFKVTKPVNHINPIKSEIAKSIGFPNLKYGEDKVYSMMIQNKIKSSGYIDKYLYNYLWTDNDNSLSAYQDTYKSLNPEQFNAS